jgi:ABC-type amino acid transport substrate-binding protein
MRSIEEANDGVIDGDLQRIADAVRLYPNLIRVPTAINRTVVVIYGASPDIASKTREQIIRLKIGYLRGILVLRKLGAGLDATEASSYPALFQMLANGRVDALMISSLGVQARIAANEVPRTLVLWPHQWATEPLYLLLNKRNADLVPRINDALVQMQKGGAIERYYEDALRNLKLRPLPVD